MKKPIKKAAKARMAEVKKIPSRGLAPTDKSVAKKNAPAYVSTNMKPKGISVRPIKEFPDSHFGALPVSMSGEGMWDYEQHMKAHGNAIKKGVDKINTRKTMSPIDRDAKKQAIMKEYQSGSTKGTKAAPKKPMTKAKSKSMPVKKSVAKSTKK